MINAETTPAATAEDLALFVASVTDRALLLAAPDGTLTYWGEGAERLLGTPRSEAVGRSIDAFWPAASGRWPQAGASITVRLEDWCKRADGSEFLADITVAPVFDGQKLRGYGLMIADVTGRRAAEHMLAESEAHMRSVLATVPDAMVVIDERG